MKVVVGFDNSDDSEAALEWAMDEAKQRDADIIVVASIRGGRRLDAELKQVLPYRRALEDVERRLTAAGIRHEIKKYARGRTFAEDVVADAADREADLIVIGLRSRAPAGRLFVGTRPRSVLIGAHCPVVVVKAKS